MSKKIVVKDDFIEITEVKKADFVKDTSITCGLCRHRYAPDCSTKSATDLACNRYELDP